MERLKEIPTANLWKIFTELSKIPHASGNENAIANWILQFAQKNNITGFIDDTGNVILRKKATKGCENKPSVCLQAHLDMVAVKGKNSYHDFLKDPLKLRIIEIKDEPFVTATDTTLGADDCIGVAAALATMTEKDIDHGPIEALFTIGEETAMVGANGLKEGILKAKYLLNLDSENDSEVIIGCAGGCDAQFTFDLKYEQKNLSCFSLVLTGLTGGHSGIEIHQKRANAIIVSSLILKHLNSKFNSLQLKSINGGSFRNAIPNQIECQFGISNSEVDLLKEEIQKIEQETKDQYSKTDPNLQIILADNISDNNYITKEVTEKIIKVISSMPDGVLTESSDFKDVVESSINIGIIRTNENELVTKSLMRSLIDTAPIANVLTKIAEVNNIKLEIGNKYPGWTPAKTSFLLNKYKTIYQDFNFVEPKVSVIHAGVECGIILSKYKNLDIISFGPTIIGAHTIDEKVSVYSVEKFWGLLLEMLQNIE